jgi:hypothetical protein
MNVVRLIQPDGVEVWLCPALVVGLWITAVEQISADGVAVHTAVAWVLPSERKDRTHVGRINIVRGSPDEVARVLGISK